MRRIVSLSLALLLLVGSVGVTVNRHFCMGELKSVALFGAAEACHVAKSPSCPMHAVVLSPTLPKKEGVAMGCCNDDHELVKADINKQQVDTPALPGLTVVAYVTSLPCFPTLVLHPRPRPDRAYANYRPPPKLLDAPRQFQVFRL